MMAFPVVLLLLLIFMGFQKCIFIYFFFVYFFRTHGGGHLAGGEILHWLNWGQRFGEVGFDYEIHEKVSSVEWRFLNLTVFLFLFSRFHLLVTLEHRFFVFVFPCRLMQQSVESVWSMAFDFILDNVQVVLQQTYGSTLKIAWRKTGCSPRYMRSL